MEQFDPTFKRGIFCFQLTLCLLKSSADNICKQFGPKRRTSHSLVNVNAQEVITTNWSRLNPQNGGKGIQTKPIPVDFMLSKNIIKPAFILFVMQAVGNIAIYSSATQLVIWFMV